jgi:hypothetical protein
MYIRSAYPSSKCRREVWPPVPGALGLRALIPIARSRKGINVDRGLFMPPRRSDPPRRRRRGFGPGNAAHAPAYVGNPYTHPCRDRMSSGAIGTSQCSP